MAEIDILSINNKKIQDVEARKDIKTIKENQINLVEDDTSMEGISDSVHDTLTTTNKKIIPAINEVNDKFKDIAKDNFYIKSQMVMPSKKNENNNNSYKIIKKDGLALTIIQKLNKEYGVYTFDTLNGETNPSSTGGSWDLIRLKKIQRFKYAYVFYKPSPISGELAVFENPAGISTIEKNYL